MSNRMSRRHLLQASGAAALFAAGAAAPTHRAHAAAEMQGAQVPGYYRFKLGDFEITVLSDGAYKLPTDFMAKNQPRDKVKAYLEAHMLNTEERVSHVNIPLINTGEELVLVDVGGGSNFLNGAGKLAANLEASGYTPDQVDKVIITHGHPDHIWGLIDDFDELLFPNATYLIAGKEWDFWGSDAAAEKLPETLQSFAVGAARRLPLIEETATQFTPEKEILPGIYAVDTPGHTPGHVSLIVRSGSEQLLVTADAITHPYISFEHPDWWPRTDIDPEMGEKSRRKILDMAAAERMLCLSYHISFPGLGRVVGQGSAYRWLPETWQWQL